MCSCSKKIKVLFLCTGNSCRSQMAEGWARYLKPDVIEPYSAGVAPAGLSSRATTVMAEAGIDISEQRSKHIDDVMDIDFDYVVTLCDSASEYCPIFPGPAKIIHKAFEDPASAVGSQEEIMAAFRKARDRIKEFVETLPESLGEKSS